MPRTRTELGRDEKIAEIVAIAERRLREGGYEAMSVVGIANELGLAQNAVYWFFPTKDHLLLAVLQEIMGRLRAEKPPHRVGLKRRVMWFVERLEGIPQVRAAMHQRAQVSPLIAEFVANTNAAWRKMLRAVLSARVPPEEMAAAADVLFFTIQGALTEDLSKRERARIVGLALDRVTAERG